MSASFRIELTNVSKRYGERTVLDVDSLVLESQRSYALVGANGSGKSTLCKVLSGVIDATGGTIDVAGDVGAAQLAVGYMPQKSYVFGFSVYKNVALALKGQSLTKGETERRVMEALESVGMADMAQQRGGGLSGGEAQRVSLARMLVRDLNVVLLDEPTASMDIAGTMLVEEALMAYRRKTGCLVVTATHAPSQARRISEQTVMLAGGRVVENGVTDDVLAHPASPEGREFLSYWQI